MAGKKKFQKSYPRLTALIERKMTKDLQSPHFSHAGGFGPRIAKKLAQRDAPGVIAAHQKAKADLAKHAAKGNVGVRSSSLYNNPAARTVWHVGHTPAANKAIDRAGATKRRLSDYIKRRHSGQDTKILGNHGPFRKGFH